MEAGSQHPFSHIGYRQIQLGEALDGCTYTRRSVGSQSLSNLHHYEGLTPTMKVIILQMPNVPSKGHAGHLKVTVATLRSKGPYTGSGHHPRAIHTKVIYKVAFGNDPGTV